MHVIALLALGAALLGLVRNAPAEGPNIDNVVIVLDASGSMKEPLGKVLKIEAAKTALKEVLKTLPRTTHIGLLVFSASNVKDWAYPLGPRNDDALMAAIDLPDPRSDTPLGTYMKMGADRLLEARKAQYGYGTYRLLVVTDGEANHEPESLVDRHTKEIMTRGITVDVIGVKMDQAHTLATKVHSYRRADDPASLRKAVAEVFAEVGKSKEEGMIGEDAFAVIAALPDAFASQVIGAFSRQSNGLIGQTVDSVPAPSGIPVPRTAASGVPSSGSSKGMGSLGMWIVVVVAVLSIFYKMKSRSR